MDQLPNLLKSFNDNNNNKSTELYKSATIVEPNSSKRISTISSSNVFGIVHENISSFFTDNREHELQPTEALTQDSVSSSHKSQSGQHQLPSSSAGSSSIMPTQPSNYMMDKLIEKFISMALPATVEESSSPRIQQRLKDMEARPNLSVQLMSKNFIQLNSRLSLPFELINEIIRFATWENQNLTLTWLLIMTNLIINPSYTIIFFVVSLILIPMSFNFYDLYRPAIEGPEGLGIGNRLSKYPVKNPHIVKPPNEFTREFLINITDLQNHMLIFIYVWDFITFKLVNHLGNFSNELVSSFMFLFLLGFVLAFYILNFLIVKLIVFFQILTVIALWTLAFLSHPSNRELLLGLIFSEDTRILLLKQSNSFEKMINFQFEFNEALPDDSHEVEVFEIQRLDEEVNEWNTSFFCNDTFTSQSTSRLLDKYHSTDNISKVKAPRNFEFVSNPGWKIDLSSPEIWITKNLIDPKTLRFDNETKWVYDIEAQGDDENEKTSSEVDAKNDSQDKEKDNDTTGKKSFRYRRRRWLCTVIRSNVEEDLNDEPMNRAKAPGFTQASTSFNYDG